MTAADSGQLGVRWQSESRRHRFGFFVDAGTRYAITNRSSKAVWRFASHRTPWSVHHFNVCQHLALVITKIVVTLSVVMKDIVAFSRALADPTRWRIVRLVMDHALCVCELADILQMPQSSVSSHVQVIRKAGLLESEKCEKWTYFQIHRDYKKLLQSLAKFFDTTNQFEIDAARSIKRLAVRESSCCPGPKSLKVRKSTAAIP